jgi:hypothetical protein
MTAGQRSLNRRTTRRSDHGTVLAISLILLMIMTLLAISTVRTATLELMMAGNAQHREKAFQLSQTGIAVAIGRLNQNKLSLDAADGWAHPGAVTGSSDQPGDEFRVDIHYLYRGAAPNHEQADPPEPLYFELESTGRTGGRNARSVQTRGFWVAGVDDRPINLTYWFAHDSP